MLSPTGDYTFGRGAGEFLINSPACVAQSILTRLRLLQGEWFLDQAEGTPYGTQILGRGTEGTRDAAMRARILGTQGVTDISQYQSTLDSSMRAWSVSAVVNTIYGQLQISINNARWQTSWDGGETVWDLSSDGSVTYWDRMNAVWPTR